MSEVNVNSDAKIDITVLITCYNESDLIVSSIETVVSALSRTGFAWEVIVTDDASRDNSTKEITEYISRNQHYNVRLNANKQNLGLANNFIDGAIIGRGEYYRFYCGDNAEPQEAFYNLLINIGKADIVIPERHKNTNRHWRRRLISRAYTSLINIISGYNLKYYNGSPIFRRIDVVRWPPITLGFGFQADLITRLLDNGFSYIPAESWTIERKGDRSSALTWRHFFSILHTLLEICIRRLRKSLYGTEKVRSGHPMSCE